MIATGTAARLTVEFRNADEVRQLGEILDRARLWLTQNDALPWPIFNDLRQAQRRALQ